MPVVYAKRTTHRRETRICAVMFPELNCVGDSGENQGYRDQKNQHAQSPPEGFNEYGFPALKAGGAVDQADDHDHDGKMPIDVGGEQSHAAASWSGRRDSFSIPRAGPATAS